MLTKDRIDSIIFVNCTKWHMTESEVSELRRLALLGLEREESRARVEACIEAETHVETSVLADCFGAFPDLEPEPQRDEREQIRKEFAEELIASLDHRFENGTAVKRLGIEAGDEYLVNEGRLRELAALFVREMVLACRFKDMIKEHQSDERDEARAERDARPDISAEDAAVFTGDHATSDRAPAYARVASALRAHAAKARPVCTCSRRLGDYCPTPDPDCAVHSTKAAKP